MEQIKLMVKKFYKSNQKPKIFDEEDGWEVTIDKFGRPDLCVEMANEPDFIFSCD